MLRIDLPSRHRAAAAPTARSFSRQSVFYPDEPSVYFPDAAGGQYVTPGALQTDQPLEICIVGRGAAALAILAELAELSTHNPRLKLHIRHLYYDEEVHSTPAQSCGPDYDTKWGRIFTVRPGQN